MHCANAPRSIHNTQQPRKKYLAETDNISANWTMGLHVDNKHRTRKSVDFAIYSLYVPF